MRTTINIDEDLLREAKKLAADSGQTLGRIVEDGIRERLARRRESSARVVLPLAKEEGGPLPGVDLNDTSSLLEMMEDLDGDGGPA